jgi:pimeloyl-ACP methyl ester carboxylesterase
VEDYTKDVAALIDEIGIKRDIVLWGNSTGGRVAQVYAGLHPERVSAVVVEDVGPERPPAISERRAKRMATEENGWASEHELLAQVKATYPRTPEPLLEALVRHGSKLRADGRIVWKRDPAINNGFVPTELWRYVRSIRAPITYILGGASTIVPPETQEELKRALPQVRIVTMPGLGHYPSEEKPAEFLALADRFLEEAKGR